MIKKINISNKLTHVHNFYEEGIPVFN